MNDVVLLVDDDENVLRGLGRTLRQQPYELLTAHTGDEAMEVLKAHPVDVLVADEQMPGVSGTDLLAWAAAHFPETVRIMLTGQATTQTTIRAINEGAVYHFFTKPCRDLDLVVTIRKALEHKELLSANRRLIESSAEQRKQRDRLRQDLEILARIADRDLHKPLQLLWELCHSSDGQCREMSDPEVSAVIETGFLAVDEVKRFLASILKGFPAEEGPESTDQDASPELQSSDPAAT